MKARLWLLVIILVICLLAVSLYAGWKRAGISSRVERRFRSRLEQLSGARATLEEFQLGLGYIQIQGLRLADEQRGYLLTVERTRLSLSLVGQLLGGLGMAAGIQEVFLSHPHLDIDLDRFRQAPEAAGGGFPRAGQFLPQRITVSKGSLTITASGAMAASSLAAMDGWLQREREGQVTFRCAGCWGAKEENMVISGNFGPQFRSYIIHGELRQADLPQVFGPVLSDRFSYGNSRLFISVQAEKDRPDERPRIEGRLTLLADELVDRQTSIPLQEIRARARLQGWDLIVDGAEAKTMGGRVLARGRIVNLLRPSADLQIELRDLEAAEVLSVLLENPSPHRLPRGRVSLEGTLQGSGSEMSLRGSVSAPAVEFLGQRITGLQGRIANQGPNLVAEEFVGALPWAKFGCQGELDLSSSPPVAVLNWHLDQLDVASVWPSALADRVQGRGFAAGQISGPVTALQVAGAFRLEQMKGAWIPVQECAGRFFWDGCRLSYRLVSSDGRLCLEGGADGLSLESVHQAVLQADGLELERMIPASAGSHLAGTAGGRWILTSTPFFSLITGQLFLEPKGRPIIRFKTFAEVNDPWRPMRRIEAVAITEPGSAEQMPLDAEVHLALDDRGIRVRELRLDDGIRAFGLLEGGRQGAVNGQLICSNTKLSGPLTALFPRLDPRSVAGVLSGGMTFGGTRDRLEVTGQLEVCDGRVGHLEDLSARLPFRLEDGRLRLPGVSIRHLGRRLITLSGQMDPGGQWDLLVQGKEMAASSLAEMLQREGVDVGGRLQASCRLRGSPDSPFLIGMLRWQDGRLAGLEFDELNVDVQERDGIWYLDRCALDDWNRRRIWASGAIPDDLLGLIPGPSPEAELDLTLGADGDVLSLLPAMTSVVRSAGGWGEISLRLGGTPGALVVGSGHCRFTDGWIEPALFVRKIENLNGSMRIDEEEHILRIEELSGTVEGQSVRVGNRPRGSREDLEPLVLPGLGLDLGVFSLETDENGIEVNVPGLMAKGETGQMRFSGPGLHGPILVSGPLESPRVTGTLTLNHLTFTYPPVETSGEMPLGFLANIHWGLDVVARKDVWYENDYASLRVRDTDSRLHFSGSSKEKNLSVLGHAEADRGEIIYLDRPFQVTEFEVDFEGYGGSAVQKPDNRPFISGRFETKVYAESTGVAHDIYLTLFTIDPQTGEKVPRGKWGEFELELSSDDPGDDSQEKILAKMGYSGDYAGKAMQLLQVTLGPKLDGVFLRPVIQPLERTIRRTLGIDVVRLQTGLTWNLLSQEQSPPGEHQSLSRRLVFPRTSLLVGKYLTDSCLLSYLGKFQTRTDELLEDRLGILHRVGLEYRLSGGTILDIQYDYERDLTEGDKKVKTSSDKRIQITHHFPF